jgi:leader peptidase (prepilin peptidase)/N-methyltransferase
MRDFKKWTVAVVGVLSGVLILAAVRRFEFTPRAALNLPLMVLLAIAAIEDIHRKMSPDWLTLSGLVWVLGTSALVGWPRVADASLGLIFCGGTVLILAVISRGSIGGGDVKLMGLIGASLGWRWGFGVLAVAQLSVAIFAGCLLVARRKGLQDSLPFGPFLAVCALFAIVGKPME